jgi:hypothetical protein
MAAGIVPPFHMVGFTALFADTAMRLRSQMPQPGVSDDKWRSTTNVCPLFSGQMTIFHPAPTCRLALQVVTYPLLLGWFSLFLSQAAKVKRLTPKARSTPRTAEGVARL